MKNIKFNSSKDQPKPRTLCLLKMATPSSRITYVTGWYNDYSGCYDWECNMEDTHHGGYLAAPHDVVGWVYLDDDLT